MAIKGKQKHLSEYDFFVFFPSKTPESIMKSILSIILSLLLSCTALDTFAQSPSFQTYVNPVIPGDHPDPTLSKIGDYFYTSGSSFNPTPKIYRSSDLVHWEVIAQPVSPSWSSYGDSPGGGIWGGHMVLYNNTYWHYFGKNSQMYFVTADAPEGPWSSPTLVNNGSAGIGNLGMDNSIFIDDDGKWYMLTKHGRGNNHVVELGEDGHTTANVLDLTWLNPEEEDYPYSWAEGPVMWKHNGTYYYSFAQHLAGVQYVMKSDTLSDNPDDWTIKDGGMQIGSRQDFNTPNHIAPAVTLDDGTSWTIGHSYHRNWVTQGRQGLLLEVTYDEDGFPEFQYPQDEATAAPHLSSRGIPWMVPKSDMFNQEDIKPHWSFLGYTPDNRYSLTERPGWLNLSPHNGENTVLQNDGEHHYSLITFVDFEPETESHEAGLLIINGPENIEAKVFSSADSEGNRVLKFSYMDTEHQVENKIESKVWLKLEREEHKISGYYSKDGDRWYLIGGPVTATELNEEQTDFNNFTGNQQGLYIRGKEAFFDVYIYRDAYSAIGAQYPVNYSGISKEDEHLGSIHSGDWALYAGVEFGDEAPPVNGYDYQRTPEDFKIEASSNSDGGNVEVWIDSIDTGKKIAEYAVSNTGSWDTYIEFSAEVDSIYGRHDVYLRFTGNSEDELMRVKQFKFTPRRVPITTSTEENANAPDTFRLHQNYPNPFNPSTVISFQLPKSSKVTLKVFDILGQEVATPVNGRKSAGSHKIKFDASNLSSGMYIYRISAGDFVQTQKMMLIK